MKICMITSAEFPAREGIGNYVASLSRELMASGHEVVILTRGSAKRCYRQTVDGLQVVRVPYVPAYPIHADLHGAFTTSLIRSGFSNFDIYHYHSPLVKYSRTGRPAITTVHTPMTFDVPRVEVTDARSLGARLVLPTASARIERDLFNKSGLLATVSTQVSDELATMGFGAGRTQYIGNGVDHNLFQPEELDRNHQSVLCVGRISYRKGHFDLVDAAGLMVNSVPDAAFRVIGEGPLLPKLRRHVRERGLERSFEFLGRIPRNDLISAYQTCGVFVLPSHYEGMATVLLEAMSCGAPVVSTTVGGSTDLIESGVNGLLVPIQDTRALAGAMTEIIRDPEKGNRMGVRARTTVLGRFTWKDIASRYESAYAEVLAGSAR